jgi:hypothetical protein
MKTFKTYITEAKKSQWAHPDIDFKKVKAKHNEDPMEHVNAKHPKAGHKLNWKAENGVWEVHHKDHGHIGYMSSSTSRQTHTSGRIATGYSYKKKYHGCDLEGNEVCVMGHTWNKDDMSHDFDSHIKKKTADKPSETKSE